MRKGVILMVVMMLAPALCTLARDNKQEIANLQKELSQTQDPEDSIRLLYDIFDLSDRKEFPALLKKLDDVAARTGNNTVRLDVARHLANNYKSDSLLSILEEHVRTLPPSEDQKETLLFVKMRRVAQTERYGSARERHNNITRLMAYNDTASMSKYENVLRVFNVCEYLSMYAPGPLLVEYMEDLKNVINKSNLNNPALRNLFLTESANIYTGIGEQKKAVEADRKLLDVVAEMEKLYKAQGRQYRNYDISKYIIYRRMLSNFEAISVDEANDLYAKILNIAKDNSDVAKDLEMNKRSAAYVAMKNKRYTEALMYLKKSLPIEKSKIRKRHLLEMTITAAEATGDNLTAEAARKEYEELKAELMSEEAKQKYNELQIRYEVSALKADNAELELENRKEQITNSRRSMILVIALWVVFFAVMVISLYFWSRYHKLIVGLRDFSRILEEERDEVKQRRYYDHNQENAEDRPQAYHIQIKKKYDAQASVNKVINDLFFISSLSMEDSRKYRQNVDITHFMEECVNTITATLNRNVSINVTYPDPDFKIRVDKQCLQKLSIQILNKALELTPDGGSIGFGCTLDESAGMARFVFRHSGSGLPQGHEERIFDGFFNYQDYADNGETAMHVCRMMRFLGGCSLKSSSGRANVSGGKLVLMVPLD